MREYHKNTFCTIHTIASGNVLYDSGSSIPVLCDNLELGVGWGLWGVGLGLEVRGRFKRVETYVHLWLIHVDIWEKPTQNTT